MKYKSVLLIVSLFFSVVCVSNGQNLENFGLSTSQGLRIERILLENDNSEYKPQRAMPVFSFELNGKYHLSDDVNASLLDSRFYMSFENSLKVSFTSFGGAYPGWKGEITFENEGFDTIRISNVLPFGKSPEHVFITGKGPWNLARAFLHRPGYDPVRIILPDNAWELGYSSVKLPNGLSVCILARRGTGNGAIKQRYNTLLPPRSTITFNLFGDVYRGSWQDGMRLIFQERYLYDLYEFDNSLYERKDLMWIRESYLIALQFAWDKSFYDRFEKKYKYGNLIREFNTRFGHLDVYGIWPTWPRLGVDIRNQWDMYEDLPGGTTQLRNFARMSRQYDTKFFIAYNPWDNSTRAEDHYAGMARLIREIEADGVVLDTRGSSSYKLQSAADSVREGVVMYSEGMAVVKNMPGIVSGRVHNAIFYSPELNLNKLIKPDFAIFRVCDVGEAPLHREIAVAFFNGYGTELNLFRPRRDWQLEADYDLLAKTTMILRENSDVFLDLNWTPLLDTKIDGVYVNRWGSGGKVVYTVLNMLPGGVDMALFDVENPEGYHFVSLWNHEELASVDAGRKYSVAVDALPYKASFKGSRKEGSLDCIARFPKILDLKVKGDSLHIESNIEGRIRLWKGMPSYQGESKEYEIINKISVKLTDIFPAYEGKIVCQLFKAGKLADERIVILSGAEPWLISTVEKTVLAEGKYPTDMLLIPGEQFTYTLNSNDNFVPHPLKRDKQCKLDSFLIDKYPVTNTEYYRFIIDSRYYPRDTSNYLKHWNDGIYQQGQDKYPVVNISLEDARAYAAWAGKRLATEDEWQLAAQGTDGRKWPWGNEFHGTKCNNAFGRATPVDAFKKGESPYGVMDMIGNVWQLTNDVYDNGTHYFVIIRGGSFYKPTSSWWYVQGGPQELNKTQMLLMVSPGFDRNSTVGFRCVKDIK